MADKRRATFHGETGADRARRASGDAKMVNHRLTWKGEAWACMFCPRQWPTLPEAVDQASQTACRPRRWADQDSAGASAPVTDSTKDGK